MKKFMRTDALIYTVGEPLTARTTTYDVTFFKSGFIRVVDRASPDGDYAIFKAAPGSASALGGLSVHRAGSNHHATARMRRIAALQRERLIAFAGGRLPRVGRKPDREATAESYLEVKPV